MYRPSAPIHMANARLALEEGARAIESGEKSFALDALEGSDSSAIAVLLAWQRLAQKKNQSLAFQNVPATVASFAALYGVDVLLAGLATST